MEQDPSVADDGGVFGELSRWIHVRIGTRRTTQRSPPRRQRATVPGPGAVVDATEARLLDWRRQFPSGG